MPRHRWVDAPDADPKAPSTYWRVTCNTCGDTKVKASKRNVQLHLGGHWHAVHQDQVQPHTITPVVRQEVR